MMVIGSIAENFGNARMAFAAGVVTASCLWLTAQGLGARLLAPLFTKPSTWRVLDGTIAVILSILAHVGGARGPLTRRTPPNPRPDSLSSSGNDGTGNGAVVFVGHWRSGRQPA